MKRFVTSTLWVALAFALLAALPLGLNPGFLHTRAAGDSPNLLVRLQQMTTALQDGVFPVRWMPDAAYGFGYPFFNYYASLPMYLAALLKLYGFSFTEALKLTQAAGFLLAAAGLYGWLRAQGAKQPVAVLAAAAYTFAPFHLVNVYVRGDSLSEFWAMAWYPFILWAAWRLVRRPSPIRATWLSLAYGALILTHNVSALTFTPFVLLYIAAVWLPGALKRRGFLARKPVSLGNQLSPRGLSPMPAIWLVPLALAAGLALSAFFWLPALLETNSVQTAGLTSGFFFYGNHFRGVNLVQPSWSFDFSTTLEEGHTPFAMGLAQAIFIGLGLAAGWYAAWRRKRGGWLFGLVCAEFALATFMITPLSRFVWDHFPLLPLVQFPWRFLSIQALFGAAITGQIAALPLPLPPSAARGVRGGAALALSGLLALSTLPALHLDFLPLSDADVTAQRLQWHEYLSGSIGSTVGSEYLPAAVAPRPFTSDEMLERPARLKALAGEAEGARLEKHAASQTWAITVTSPSAAVALPLYFWPGWQAETKGQKLPVRAAPGLGYITFNLPQGAHTVRVSLGNTPLRTWASLASALAWLGLGMYFGRKTLFRLKASVHERLANKRLPSPQDDFRFLASSSAGKTALAIPGALALLCLGALLLHARPATASTGPLNADFQSQAYFYPAPVLFADGQQLRNYRYSSEHLRPGDTLTVTLDGLTDATLALASPATTLFNQPPFTQTQTGVMTIPADLPPGVYFIQLARNVSPLMPSGEGRSIIHLKPLIIDQSAPGEESAEQITPDQLRVRLRWEGSELSQNYGLTLRLYDVAGNQWVWTDPPVAYGVYPTSMWRPGEPIADRYDIPLPAGAPPGDYRFTAALYDIATLTPVQMHAFTATLTLASPGLSVKWPLTADLALNSVDAPSTVSQGDPLLLTARWVTRTAPSTNYRARWTLTGPETFSQTIDLAPGSAPGQWPANAFVLGRLSLPVPPTISPGEYGLAVVLVDEKDQPAGEAVEVGRVKITGRPRIFTLPPVKAPLEATFGGIFKLWGYDYAGGGRLTLTWSALSAPERDYKLFVHLFNPADNFIVTQSDAMPRDNTYPTSRWAKGEVVTDTVTLDLADVPAGDYSLAIGWYDGTGRLPALDAQDQPLDNNRLVLPEIIHIP